jgi:hypothetical protein
MTKLFTLTFGLMVMMQMNAQTILTSAIIKTKSEMKNMDNVQMPPGMSVQGGGGARMFGGGMGETSIYIKGQNLRSYNKIESEYFSMNRITYYNDSSKITTQLMERDGDKSGFTRTPEDDAALANERKDKKDSMWIEYTDSTKTISKYKCKLAIINRTGRKGKILKSYVWYFPFVKLPFQYNFGQPGVEKLDGMPMEFEAETPFGATLVTTITTLELNPDINDLTFVLPTDYKMMTFQQWQDQRQRGGGGFRIMGGGD